MTPFEKFFAHEWPRMFDALATHDSGPVFSDGSGIAGASWDRKACYLLWRQMLGPPSFVRELAQPAEPEPW